MMDVYEENPKIYISYEDFNVIRKCTLNNDLITSQDLDSYQRILKSLTAQQFKTLEEVVIYQNEIAETNKHIGELMRQRDALQDVIDEDMKQIIFPGEDFNDILPNEKGEM